MKFKYIVSCFLLSLFACSTSDNNEINEEEVMEMEIQEMTSNAFMGDFISGAHTTSGKAVVSSDKTTLSFTNFMTDNGPALVVYISTDENSTDFITLGELQGISGNFMYDLPENINFETYKYVHIWCIAASVSFGYAILE